MERAPSYFEYCRGTPGEHTPRKVDTLPAPEPEPESSGIEVVEEEFDSMSGLFRRVGELMMREGS